MKVIPIYTNVPPIGVTIEMNAADAKRLKEVIGSISGDPDHPMRLAMSSLFAALGDAGIETQQYSSFVPGHDCLRVKDVT